MYIVHIHSNSASPTPRKSPYRENIQPGDIVNQVLLSKVLKALVLPTVPFSTKLHGNKAPR